MNETISDIFNNAFSNAISDFRAQGLSESEIVERLSQQTITDAMQKLIDQASADTLTYLTDRIFEIEHQRIIENNRFLAHHNAIWSECFAVSEAMYVTCALFVLDAPRTWEYIRRLLAKQVHGNLTPAGSSASSVEKYH